MALRRILVIDAIVMLGVGFVISCLPSNDRSEVQQDNTSLTPAILSNLNQRDIITICLMGGILMLSMVLMISFMSGC